VPRYQRKPIVIDAIRFDPYVHPWPDGVEPGRSTFGYICSVKGYVAVFEGWWIITLQNGDKDVRSPESFLEEFEVVS